MEYPALALYIDGRRLTGEGRSQIDVLDPASEAVLGQLPMARPDDVAQAITAADRTFPIWAATSPLRRSAVLRRTADLLRARRAMLSALVTAELGKPRGEADQEIDRAAEMFEWAAEETRRLYGRQIPAREPSVMQLTMLEPVGPVAAFAGWNAPAITPSRKLAGALAAGCTVVLKASEETPAIALEIMQALHEAGLPAGAANLVFGDPVAISEQLLDAPAIRMITFTGSTAIGKALAARAAAQLKPMALELGGHAPVLVFEDADIDRTADRLIAAKLRNAGQICTSPTRIYAHESVHRALVAALAERARAWRVGDGREPDTQMGPLANPRRLQAIAEMVEEGEARGCRVAAGGRRIGTRGWFWQPTILDGVGDDALAANVEPFGPLALVRAFATDDEAVALANRLPFGLAAYFCTGRADRIHDVSARIRSGVVCVNHFAASLPETPFGGVLDSGIGREGGIEGLMPFLQTKYLSIAHG
jgi:succinate-semialdehyde dehydrogenase/glutarate-semialdehyde dehydrogenase